MAHKNHLQHTAHGGPTCQTGRTGGQLRGEHFTMKFSEFIDKPVETRCVRCGNSKLFAFLARQADKALIGEWEPVDDPEAWKAADDALIAAHRARQAA